MYICPKGAVPQSQVLSQVSCPRSFPGSTPLLSLLGAYPSPTLARECTPVPAGGIPCPGVPSWPGQDLRTPCPRPQTEHQREHLLHSEQYAFHICAGGLSFLHCFQQNTLSQMKDVTLHFLKEKSEALTRKYNTNYLERISSRI